MKKNLLIALGVALLGAQLTSAGAALNPAPVIGGKSLAPYADRWDMVTDVFIKAPRRVAIKNAGFAPKSLIIPAVATAVTIIGVKLLEYYLYNYDYNGYHKTSHGEDEKAWLPWYKKSWTAGTDWEGYDKDGLRRVVKNRYLESYNRDGENIAKLPKPDDDWYSKAKHKLGTLWQNARWFTWKRIGNPGNHVAALAGLAAGAAAFSPTGYQLLKNYGVQFKAEQEKQVDRVVDVWKAAKQFFPEELHQAFDTLSDLKAKKSGDYEATRARVIALINTRKCPVI